MSIITLVLIVIVAIIIVSVIAFSVLLFLNQKHMLLKELEHTTVHVVLVFIFLFHF